MNKTFLTLLLLGVSYTAYNAVAVSENFEISTTIDHEIVLGGFRAASTDAGFDISSDINLGTIVIDPTKNTGSFEILSDESLWWGEGDDGIISITGYSCGRFSTNIEIYDAIDSFDYSALTMNGSYVDPAVYYDGDTRKKFMVCPQVSYKTPPSQGLHTGTFTVSYTPS